MEKVEAEVDQIQKLESERDVISAYASMIYKTSNGEVGTTAHMIQKSGPFGRTAGFSNHLAKAGNFNNNGLNTICEGDRFMDNSKDWMAKNN